MRDENRRQNRRLQDRPNVEGEQLPSYAKTQMEGQKILVGRPRVSVDFAIVLRLRDEQNLGWSRMALAYRELTGEYVSRDTIKRRYFEAKNTTNPSESNENLL